MTKDLIQSHFQFNPWKHHLGWIIECVNHIKNYPEDLTFRNELLEQINSINSNYVDIYTGHKNPEQLIQAIFSELDKLKVRDRNEFRSWIGDQGFKLITLSDNSVWVLREGNEDELYIHIHPARNSPNTKRIHGNSWKTAIIIKMFNPSLTNLNITTINDFRAKHLNLSPIKSLHHNHRLNNAMKLLTVSK